MLKQALKTKTITTREYKPNKAVRQQKKKKSKKIPKSGFNTIFGCELKGFSGWESCCFLRFWFCKSYYKYVPATWVSQSWRVIYTKYVLYK